MYLSCIKFNSLVHGITLLSNMNLETYKAYIMYRFIICAASSLISYLKCFS